MGSLNQGCKGRTFLAAGRGIPVTRVSYNRRGGWVDLINQAQQAAASAQQNCCYVSSLV